MTWSMVGWVLLAATIHAVWNLMMKRSASVGAPFVWAMCCATSVIYAPWGVWALWQGVAWSWAVVGCLLASAVMHLLYNLCLQHGYRVSELSVVYPVARGTGPLLSTLGAFLLLGETPQWAGVLGAALVVVGIVLIATQGRWAQFRQPRAWQGVRWGMLTGLLIAGYTLIDAYGVKVLLLAPVLTQWGSNVLRAVILTGLGWRRRAEARQAMRGHWGRAWLIGAIAPMGYIPILITLEQGAPLSLVAPMREVSMMIATVLGAWLLREAVGPWRYLGCVLMVGGVVLLGVA